MIKLVDSSFPMPDERDPFLCRIRSLYEVYGTQVPFADFWLGISETGVFTSAISRLDSQLVLYLTQESDLEETAEFIYAVGASSVLCDSALAPPIKYPVRESGYVLKFSQPTPFNENIKAEIPSLKSVFNLLQEEFGIADEEGFYLDISHKLLKNRARVYAVMRNGRPVSCAMTVAESENSAIIGAVATDKEYRKNSFASALVSRLCFELTAEGKTPYVYVQNKNAEFYKKLGFINYGEWTEFRLN